MVDLSFVTRPMGINRPLDMFALLNAIDVLREDEGASVTFVCDNPDFNGQPNSKVICCGPWTLWQEREFTGGTAFEALGNALREYSRLCDSNADPINLQGSGPAPIAPREG